MSAIDPYARQRFKCRDDGTIVNGTQEEMRAHNREHSDRGDGPAEWDAIPPFTPEWEA